MLVDKETRNAFPTSFPNRMLKCSVRFNHYNTHDNIINKKEKIEIYPRYIVIESWNHIILY